MDAVPFLITNKFRTSSQYVARVSVSKYDGVRPRKGIGETVLFFLKAALQGLSSVQR